MIRKPLIAIVGRPNVGKSTLFNRLVGDRRAITDDTAGTTRDRLYADAAWQGKTVTLIDTGGVTERAEPHDGDASLRESVNAQVAEAVAEADAILLLVDATAGVTSEDTAVAVMLRKVGKRVIVVANKADNQATRQAATDFWEFGLGEPLAVSALHGKGTGDLLDRLTTDATTTMEASKTPATHPTLTIVGRANVGKSTLFNQLAGRPARITSQRPHTTRDTAVCMVDSSAGPLAVLDTAGVPRRHRTGRGLPKYSLLRTIRAINQADVVCLLLDGEEGPTVQDAHLTSYVLEAGKAIVVAVNKWDLVAKTPTIQEAFFAKLEQTLGFLPAPPVVFISALTGEKLDRLSRAVYDVWRIAATRVETAALNRFAVAASQRLPGGKGGPKLRYLTQVETRPPTFVGFVNSTNAWQDHHRRYLINALRDEYGLLGTTIRLHLRSREPRRVAK